MCIYSYINGYTLVHGFEGIREFIEIEIVYRKYTVCVTYVDVRAAGVRK